MLVPRWSTRLRRVVALATPLALAGCAGPLSTLDPAGPRAANLSLLWWVMLWGALALFVIVIVLFALVYLRPALLARLTPMQWIVGGGLVLPVPVLVVLTGTALVLGEQLLPHGDQPVRVAVNGERWQWRVSYPEAPDAGVHYNVLHMPAGQPVDFVVTASDVIHGFWIPRLGGKIDAIPGHTNVIRLEADRPGTYWGVCAEYCGEGHDTMWLRVEAHPAETFAGFISGDIRFEDLPAMVPGTVPAEERDAP